MNNKQASDNAHQRARRLIDRERVEGLEPEERRWLVEHLRLCADCASRSASTEATMQALKSISVPVPPGLAASTSLRVREKALEMKGRRTRKIALVTACSGSWAAGVASAPLVWKACEWLGTTLDLPRIVWVLGFLSWWLVPAVSAALVILWVTARADREGPSFQTEMADPHSEP